MSRQTIEGDQYRFIFPTVEPHPGMTHVLTAEYLQIDPADYVDITPEIAAHADPALLATSLIDITPADESAVGYPSHEPRKFLYIALEPGQYSLLPRSVHALGKKAANVTRNARVGVSFPNVPSNFDEGVAASHRSAAHANERFVEQINTHISGVILPRLAMIDRFLEAAASPNLARIGKAKDMRDQFHELQQEVIGGMLLAIGAQRGWGEKQMDLASRSIIYNTVLVGEEGSHQRARNEAAILALAKEWYGHQLALFKSKEYEIARYVGGRYLQAARYQQ